MAPDHPRPRARSRARLLALGAVCTTSPGDYVAGFSLAALATLLGLIQFWIVPALRSEKGRAIVAAAPGQWPDEDAP